MNPWIPPVAGFIGIATAVLLIWLACRVTRCMAIWPRRGVHLVAVPCALIAGTLAMHATFLPVDEGTWICLVCGEMREEVRYLGVTLTVDDPDDVAEYLAIGAKYEDWYWDVIGAEHEHSWRAAGCHRLGAATIACSFMRVPHIQHAPDLRDQDLAVEVVGRFVDARSRDRAQLLEDLLRAQAASESRPDSAEAMVPVFEAWLGGGVRSGAGP